MDLMRARKVETRFSPEDLEGACLLCSEATAERCHRRLVCDYLASHWDTPVEVRHL